MLSIGRAFAWDLLGKDRYWLLPMLGYLLLLALAVQLCPAGTFEVERHQQIVGWLSMPLGCGVLMLLMVFSDAERADLLAPASGYPRRRFTWPLPTPVLAAWPLALGSLSVILYWLALAGLIVRPVGIDLPLGSVAVFLAALLAWVQALLWTPFPLPWLRLLVGAPLLFGLVLVAALAVVYEVPPAVSLTVSALLLPAGYAAAAAGLRRARHGDFTVRRWSWSRARADSVDKPPFALPGDALRWLGWQRVGMWMPVMTALTITPILLIILITGQLNLLEFQTRAFVGSMYFALPLLAAAAGMSSGNYHTHKQDAVPLPAFLGARPVTTPQLLAARFRVAADSMLLTCALCGVLFVLFLPFSPVGTQIAQWARALVDAQGYQGVLLLVLAVLALPLLMIRAVFNHLWINLTGRPWVLTTMIFAALGTLVAMAIFGSSYLPNPEMQAALQAVAPWLIGGLLTLKLGLGAVIVRALLSRRLLFARTFRRLAAAWLAGAGVLIALSFWLTPPEFVSPLLVSAATLLLLPLVRLGLAPLALEWNRHR